MIVEFNESMTATDRGIVDPVESSVGQLPSRIVGFHLSVVDQLDVYDLEEWAATDLAQGLGVCKCESFTEPSGEVGFESAPVVLIGELQA